MPRVPLLTSSTASTESQSLLEQIHVAFGATPNMFKAVASSPAALKSMWGTFAALSKGALEPRLREKIAVAVAERNGCEYCLAAHMALGRKAGASADDLAAAQMGESGDPQTAAALRFALQLVNERGHVSDADVQAVRAAGYGDAEVVEILAHVALNLFTNYANVAFAVPVDFPAAPLRRAAGPMLDMHMTHAATLLQEITAANQHLMDCFASGDAAAMARCYAEDAHLLVPHADVIEGRAAIEWVFKKTMSPGQVYVFKTVELDGDTQSALEIGRYTRADREGTLLDKGKYIVRWKRIGHDWRIHRDMLSTSLPKGV